MKDMQDEIPLLFIKDEGKWINGKYNTAQQLKDMDTSWYMKKRQLVILNYLSFSFDLLFALKFYYYFLQLLGTLFVYKNLMLYYYLIQHEV